MAQANASTIFAKLYERFDRNKDQVLPSFGLAHQCSMLHQSPGLLIRPDALLMLTSDSLTLHFIAHVVPESRVWPSHALPFSPIIVGVLDSSLYSVQPLSSIFFLS
jgi:hypothetical protein